MYSAILNLLGLRPPRHLAAMRGVDFLSKFSEFLLNILECLLFDNSNFSYQSLVANDTGLCQLYIDRFACNLFRFLIH